MAFAQDELHIDIPEIEITVIYDPPPKRKDGTTPVIIQFLSSDKRTEIMRKRKSLKGINIFMNDHLSRLNNALSSLNNALFHRARTLRKENKINSTWTPNCVIYVKKTEQSTPIQIRAHTDFDKL